MAVAFVASFNFTGGGKLKTLFGTAVGLHFRHYIALQIIIIVFLGGNELISAHIPV